MNSLDYIGNTPLVKTTTILSKPSSQLWLKLEGNNPGGSVKDRAAFNMIKSALERKDISRGDHLVEATSGNTGIALAYIARLLGLKISLILPEHSTKERIQTMRAYGAEVVLTPTEIGIEGSRDVAEEYVKEKGYFMLDQFSNEDNWKAHYKTTGPEIWEQTQGKITHFVSAMGTTGTITGVSKFLKEKNKDIIIVGAQPEEGSRIPGIRKWSPEYIPSIYNPEHIDRIVYVNETEAKTMTHRLAKDEGVFAGMSSGGAAAVAQKISKELTDAFIVSIICDRGDRYLSSGLFE